MNTILFRLFYDLSVYKTAISQTTGRNFLRFILCYLILSFGYSLHLSLTTAPTQIAQAQTLINQITAQLPGEASFSLQDYQLQASGLSLPLVVADTIYLNPNADAVALSSVSATIALGSTHFRVESDPNSYQVFSYRQEEITDLQFSGQQINQQLRQLENLLNRIQPYLPLFLTVPTFIGLIITRLFSILFYSLISRLFTRLSVSQYSFTEFFRLYLNTTIPIETISLAVLILYGPSYTMVYSIGLVGLSILAFLHLPARLKLEPNKLT